MWGVGLMERHRREPLNSVRLWRPGAFAAANARSIDPVIGHHATVVDSVPVVVHTNFRSSLASCHQSQERQDL